ncbi:MAG: DegT/DnrJ/EryC1/StrS aminotransferase family protein [Planctomycetia bacterium]|nr:DegT/DnrJ/EryC1/StrS aminotransferase family protein [Planctomycetia bacterium]
MSTAASYNPALPHATDCRLAVHGGRPIQPEGPPTWPLLDAAVETALNRAFADGSWGKYHGSHCLALNEMLVTMHSREHVVLTCSGTAAVELALRGLRVGTGDEVLLSAYDFEGNFKNVLAVGAKPVLIDIDPQTGQLDVTQLELARSPQTKAIIASHLHGGVVDMPALRAFANQYQLAVIEDAAQMPGAMIHGRIAGTWGDIGILSFGGSKLLTSGRGGALFTNDSTIVQRIRLHTQRGNDTYPLSELQAAVLLPQFERLTERNRRRAANVGLLLEMLRDTKGLSSFVGSNDCGNSFKSLDFPIVTARVNQPGFYKLGFWYDSAQFGGLSRDQFACSLRAEGIALDPGFRALHLTHSKGRFRAVNDLPNASRADTSLLVLHHPVLLGSENDLRQIAEALSKVTRSVCQDELQKRHH